MKEMSDAIKSAVQKSTLRDDLTILAPGLYGYRNNGCHPACHQMPVTFLKRMDTKLSTMKATEAYDALSLHPYVFKVGHGSAQHAPENRSEVREISDAIQNVVSTVHNYSKHNKYYPVAKRIWITELGFPVANPGGIGGIPRVTEPIQ